MRKEAELGVLKENTLDADEGRQMMICPLKIDNVFALCEEHRTGYGEATAGNTFHQKYMVSSE